PFLATSALAPTSAATKRVRFSTTFSRASQSVTLRFNTRWPLSSLAPPGRVLKPWTSHGMRASDAACTTRTPLSSRSSQLRLAANFDGDLLALAFGARRFCLSGFVDDMNHLL